MIKFEKVSWEEYKNSIEKLCSNRLVDIDYEGLKQEWENIKLPTRATKNSAGYDFYAPCVMNFYPSAMPATVYSTGIRFITDRDDIFLMCVPRSGLGFKKGLKLLNTCGIIDSDYWQSDNEGHIKVKMSANEILTVTQGQAFMQGIIVPFLKVDSDDIKAERNGGFGSTDQPFYIDAREVIFHE